VKSGFYRRPDGTERIWFKPADVEAMMESELEKAGLYPTPERPAVDVEKFIARHLKVDLDQYAELERDVLGLTEFYQNRAPRILINRDLSGAIDDDDTPPGMKGRWRATLAHEASHVLMHRVLFEVQAGQGSLFRVDESNEQRQLMRCQKRAVLFRAGGSDWREIQANMGMAALLMPARFFSRLVGSVVDEQGLSRSQLTSGTPAHRRLVELVAERMEVSRQAAAIRLESLSVAAPRGQQAF
jgi:hypothetical protein